VFAPVQTALGTNLNPNVGSALRFVADHLLYPNVIQVGFRLFAYSRQLFSRGRLQDDLEVSKTIVCARSIVKGERHAELLSRTEVQDGVQRRADS
jgi:hypothetical protein